MKELTKRQMEIFDFIRTNIELHGYPPTVREIGTRFSISVKGAYDHIKAVEKKGYIRCTSSKSRAIEIVGRGKLKNDGMVTVPVLGMTTAGFPMLAEQHWEDVYHLPKALIGDDELFALRVRGNSMIGAGISDGDLALIKKQETAENGDVIVALMGEEATIKRFFKKHDRVVLSPENKDYADIVTKDVKVLGKVAWVFRKIS